MNLKALYHRFRAWQLEPYQFKSESEKKHQCFNCGKEFEGNYCPICGQYFNEGPVNWKPEEEVHKPLWGLLEPGSVLSFVIQVLLRPGYMISDYLKGRKQVTGSPIGALCYVAAGVLVILSLLGKDGSDRIPSQDGELGVMGICLEWMMSHMDWAILIQTVLLILPVWLLFRFAPKHPRHTIKEGFYIQAFMASVVLVCIALRALISNWLILLVLISYYVVFRQLFGYGIWGTLWRTVLSFGIVSYVFAVIMMTAWVRSGKYSAIISPQADIALAAGLIVAGVGVVLLGYWIGKKTERRE